MLNTLYWSYAFQYADLTIRKKEDFILELVKYSAEIINYIDDNLKKNKKFILRVLSIYSDAYNFIDESFKRDNEIFDILKNNKFKK